MCVALSLQAARAAEESAAFVAPSQLVVVTDINYPPYLFQTTDGRLAGILNDKWALWSKRTGIRVRVVGMEWAKAQESVQAGVAEVIEALAHTKARVALYEFSPPYAHVDARVYFRESISGINDVESMRGFPIGAKAGSACGAWLEERGVRTVPYATSDAVVEAASKGAVGLFCMDVPAAEYLLFKQSLAGRFRQTPPLYSTQFHWAVKKGRTDLRDFIQDGFEKITSQELAAIDARWLGNPLRVPLDRRYVYYLAAFAAAVLGSAALLLFWNRTLKRRVTERTAELHEGEARLRALIDALAEGVVLVDRSGQIVAANSSASRILGISHAELLAFNVHRPLLSIVLEDSSAVPVEKSPALNALRTGKAVFGTTLRVVRLDGTQIWISVNAVPLFRAGEAAPYAAVNSFIDISGRKRAEQALEYRHRLVSMILAISTQFISLRSEQVDAEILKTLEAVGSFVHADRCFVTQVDDLAQTYSQTHEWCAPGIPSKQALRQGLSLSYPSTFWERLQRDEIVYVRLRDLPEPAVDRRRFLIDAGINSALIVPLRSSGKVRGYFGFDSVNAEIQLADEVVTLLRIVADIITGALKRKRDEEQIHNLNTGLERRVRERTMQLQAANKDLEAFSYSVSHDLRAPLRHIGSFVSILQNNLRDRLDAESQRQLEMVKDASRRMGKLIDDLLAFSRLGRAALNKRSVNLQELVTEVMQLLEPETKDRAIVWRIAELPPVFADRALLRQVFVNLLSNAVKYTRPRAPAEIEVGCIPSDEPGGGPAIFVRDNGVGFDMKYSDKLFGVFQRLHPASDFEGSGIGLANAANIVRRHGGRIWARGEKDKGATVYFSLPEQTPAEQRLAS
jgi:PAS domain S-box-containing protein